MVKNQSQFTREQRMAIVTEFDNGTMSGAEIAQKYGLKYPSLIANWRKRLQKPPVYLQKSKKVVPLHAESSLKWLMRSL